MLANISEIITDVRSLINEETASFWSDTEITRWVNEGQEIFSSETGLLSKYYSITLKAANINNDREIRLPSDFIAFDEGGVLYDDDPCLPVTLQELDEWHGNWRDTTGTPNRYYTRGDYLGFFPKPSAGDTVKFYGIERATTLSGDTTPFSGDYRTVAFRRCIRDYAIAKCWYKKKERQDYIDAMSEFWNGVRRANAILNKNKNSNMRMIPGYRPKGNYYGISYGDTSRFD